MEMAQEMTCGHCWCFSLEFSQNDLNLFFTLVKMLMFIQRNEISCAGTVLLVPHDMTSCPRQLSKWQRAYIKKHLVTKSNPGHRWVFQKKWWVSLGANLGPSKCLKLESPRSFSLGGILQGLRSLNTLSWLVNLPPPNVPPPEIRV